jgi:hypothetical protein
LLLIGARFCCRKERLPKKIAETETKSSAARWLGSLSALQ